jgi:hypothetical protein
VAGTATCVVYEGVVHDDRSAIRQRAVWVSIDSILEALRQLDKVSADSSGAAWVRRQARRRFIEDSRGA